MKKQYALILPLLTGLALAALMAAVLFAEEDRFHQKYRLSVFNKLSTLQGGFENALNSRLHIASALNTFVTMNPVMDESSFQALASGLLEGISGVRKIQLTRHNNDPFVYPPTTHDMRPQTQSIKKLVQRAISSKTLQILPPMRTHGGDESILSISPIYLRHINNGKEIYWGLITLYIDPEVLYQEAGFTDNIPDLNIALRQPNELKSHMIFGIKEIFRHNPVIMSVPVPNGYWQIAAIPKDGWPSSPAKPYILFGGAAVLLLVATLLMAAMYLLVSRLREREKYQYLVQNAKSIIMRIDLSGNITFCNEHAEEFYGYDPGELLGKPLLGTLIPEKSLQGKSMKRYMHQLLSNPDAHPFNESMHICKGGEIVWVAWANQSVRDAKGDIVELLSVGTDITDRKLMEEAVRQRERQYRLLAENVTDVIWGVDTDLRCTFISPSDETLRGYKRQDVLGRSIKKFLAPKSHALLDEALIILKEQAHDSNSAPSMNLDMEFTCSDGSTVWLENSLSLLTNEDGNTIGFQAVGRDITDRRHAESLREDMERMARHDLKTPLGAVIGLPDEIRRIGSLTEPQNAMLSTITEAGESMLTLINKSLDLFKMERGNYVLNRSEVNVLALLESIQSELRSIMREKGVSIGIDNLSGQEDLSISVDRELFKSLLSNLLTNALQATTDGGMISITLQQDMETSISITNQGEVPQALRDSFFDKYSCAENSPGAGLGTYSARLIARTHQGTIELDTSVPGKTTLVVLLPLETPYN